MTGPEQGGVPSAWGGGLRTWRCGHADRDRVYYEEWQDGGWARIVIDGELLASLDPHHLIFWPSEADWRCKPPWAQGRRDQIFGRLRRDLGPGYEYTGE